MLIVLFNAIDQTCGEDTIDMILGESAKFCENVLDPLNAVGDTVGKYNLNGVIDLYKS